MSFDRFSLRATLEEGSGHYGARFMHQRECTLKQGPDGNWRPVIDGATRKEFLVCPDRYDGRSYWHVYRLANDGRRRFLARFVHSWPAERYIADIVKGRQRFYYRGIPFKASKFKDAKREAKEGPQIYQP